MTGGDEEQVVRRLHPHWKELVGPLGRVPLVVGLASYGVTALPSGGWEAGARWAVLAVAAVVLAGWSLRPFLRWRATVVLLTDQRLAVRTGVLRRRGRDLPLSRVADVSFERSPFQRLLGCGTLHVAPAGEAAPLVLVDLPDVEGVQRDLHRLLQEAW